MTALLAELLVESVTTARATFDAIEAWLSDEKDKTALQLEDALSVQLRQLARKLLEEHFARRAAEAATQAVTTPDGDPLPHVREMERGLETQFGEVTVPRPSHSARGHQGVRPLDDALELPRRRYSYPVQKLATAAAVSNSYDEALAALSRHTGAHVPKRQLEELIDEASQDVDSFYEDRVEQAVEAPGAVLVVSADGKGIPMLQRDLRPETREAAQSAKLSGRRSKGERPHRKREATVGTVYSIAPHLRTAEAVVAGILGLEAPPSSEDKPDRPAPVAKRVWASLSKSKEDFFYALTAEALRHTRPDQTAVFLVDGALTYQRLGKEIVVATLVGECERVLILVDLIHVAAYLWDAAWCFFAEGDRAAEQWVARQLTAMLEGKATRVAAALRATATRRGLAGTRRKRVDRAANYLLKNAEYMAYDEALRLGLPVTTSAVEGVCKNLVRDRFEVAGARWSLDGAEALLKLRSVYRSGDWDAYWDHHVAAEQARLRAERPAYAVSGEKQPHLRVLPGGRRSSS